MFITIVLEALLTALALLLAFPACLLMVECLAGSLARRRHPRIASDPVGPWGGNTPSGNTSCGNTPSDGRPSIDVLVPAHNEETVIGRTLASILSQLAPGDRLCVVADNCTDETASIARAAGAEVVERVDENRRAKGYAVAEGLRTLEQDAREVVVMIDADCLIGQGCLDALSRRASATGKPVQANYSMVCESSADGWGAISSFAVTVKNHVRPLGLSRMGYGCALTGSGMAFPKDVARQVQWASGNIVEDMKLSYDYAILDKTPQYCADAVVLASLPSRVDDAMNQRKRWEHGHLETIVSQVPRLLRHSIQGCRPDLVIAACDLLIPPLALFVQIWLVSIVGIALCIVLFGLSLLPLAIAALGGTAMLVGVLVAWFRHGRSSLPFAKLCMVPVYVLSKVPLYLTALIRRQATWNRTARTDSEAPACT